MPLDKTTPLGSSTWTFVVTVRHLLNSFSGSFKLNVSSSKIVITSPQKAYNQCSPNIYIYISSPVTFLSFHCNTIICSSYKEIFHPPHYYYLLTTIHTAPQHHVDLQLELVITISSNHSQLSKHTLESTTTPLSVLVFFKQNKTNQTIAFELIDIQTYNNDPNRH